MFCSQKYNLNEMAHEATIGLIRRVLDLGINISEVSLLVMFNNNSQPLSLTGESVSDLCGHGRSTI